MKQAQLSSLGVADTGKRHKVPAVSKVHRLVRREWCGEPGGGGDDIRSGTVSFRPMINSLLFSYMTCRLSLS